MDLGGHNNPLPILRPPSSIARSSKPTNRLTKLSNPHLSLEHSARRAARTFLTVCLGLVLLAGTGCSVLERRTSAPETGLNPGSTWTLPATFEDDAIFVEAYVGSVGPLRLMVDTGASCLVLSPDVAARARQDGSLQRGRPGKAGTASGKRLTVEFATAKNVRLGKWTTRKTPVAITDFKDFNDAVGGRLDGIAGMALFASGTLTLDYPGHELRFSQGSARLGIETNAVQIPCRYRTYVPQADLHVGRRRRAAVVDSGFNGSFQLPGRSHEPGFMEAPVVSAATANLDGLVEGRHARLATNISWGGLTFVHPVVQTSPDGPFLIGTRVLREFVTHLDQKNRRLWVSPRTNSPIVFPPWRSLGLALSSHEAGLIVRAIIPNTVAARTDLRVGDIITSINGEPAKVWSRRRLSALRDTADIFTVERMRNGQAQTLKLKVAVLVR